MAALLQENGYQLSSSQEEAYTLIINICTGNIKYDEIVNWLRQNTKTI